MPVVVGSSAEMAKFFLKTHDAAFADRPRFAVGKHTTYDYSDILWAPYGAYLRQARRICTAELFSAKWVESLEYIRDEEVRALLRDLRGASGSVVRLKGHLQMAALGVISRMVLGKKYVEAEDAAAEGAACRRRRRLPSSGSSSTSSSRLTARLILAIMAQLLCKRSARTHPPLGRAVPHTNPTHLTPAAAANSGAEADPHVTLSPSPSLFLSPSPLSLCKP
ncbi:hypothetical protein SEVIR_2G228632v4 [Setaria viridis]|uniref:Uncharacterized protein n=1 Tax=Setaria viridis TaxID=4556 RepID=A0A4U6VWE9_SETVI|nr:hypothetical protein SEVIR_2G228632v2 [Setaria viridis]